MIYTKKKLSVEQKVFIVKNFYWNHEDVYETKDEFQRTFGTKTNPNIYATFHKIISDFEGTGGTENEQYYECEQEEYETISETVVVEQLGEEIVLQEECLDLKPESSDDNGNEVVIIENYDMDYIIIQESEVDVKDEEIIVEEIIEDQGHKDQESSLVEEDNTKSNIPLEEPKKSSKSGLKQMCEFCGKVFSSSFYYHHIQTHNNKKYDCKDCGKSFFSQRYLKRHMEIHNPNKVYVIHVCDICGHNSNSRMNHKRHMKIHSGVRPFACEMCGKTFARSHNLSAHVRTHTGEKPYQCRYCEKSFGTHTSYSIHTRTHTGERPYQCEYCNKTFIGSSARNVHLKTHHQEYKDKCVICSKRFKTTKILQDHMKLKHSTPETVT